MIAVVSFAYAVTKGKPKNFHEPSVLLYQLSSKAICRAACHTVSMKVQLVVVGSSRTRTGFRFVVAQADMSGISTNATNVIFNNYVPEKFKSVQHHL